MPSSYPGLISWCSRFGTFCLEKVIIAASGDLYLIKCWTIFRLEKTRNTLYVADKQVLATVDAKIKPEFLG
jgi:hypothetical protein